MYLHYQLMKTLQDERLLGAARDHLAAEARRARTAGRDHAAATTPGATARSAATMHGKQGAIIGLGIPLGAVLLFPQGIIPAALKLANAPGRIWFLPLYLPRPLQWPACFVMIILGVAVYCYVLWTMRQLKKSSVCFEGRPRPSSSRATVDDVGAADREQARRPGSAPAGERPEVDPGHVAASAISRKTSRFGGFQPSSSWARARPPACR